MSKKNEVKQVEILAVKGNTAIAAPFGIDQETMIAVAANMEHVDLRHLGIIKTPSGGSLSFTVETPEGEQGVNEIIGVIIAIKHPRAFYLHDLGKGEKGAPNCSSEDGCTGVYSPEIFATEGAPEPAGECKICHYSRPAQHLGWRIPCKEYTTLYLLCDDKPLPYILRLAPTSGKDFQKYLISLIQTRIAYFNVRTRFGLRSEMSKTSGQKYSIVTSIIDKKSLKLTEDEKRFVADYREKFSPLIDRANSVLDIVPEEPEMATMGTANGPGPSASVSQGKASAPPEPPEEF